MATEKNDLLWILKGINISTKQMNLVTKIRNLKKFDPVVIKDYCNITNFEVGSTEGMGLELDITVDDSLKHHDDVEAYLKENKLGFFNESEGTEIDEGDVAQFNYILDPTHEIKLNIRAKNYR